MISGSCLCGQVRYEVDGELGGFVHCHCQTCRKAHGSAFSSVAAVPKTAFRWVAGESLLKAYESSPGKFRSFCTNCGSHIVANRPAQPVILLRLGCLDTPAQGEPKCHIWRSDGAPWYDPGKNLPVFAEGFPAPPRE
ncbi:MAG: GFA family protein [Alphaproteobacteria bacterium]|nr:GFA family protein [Alphaproteobacteria bacterium]